MTLTAADHVVSQVTASADVCGADVCGAAVTEVDFPDASFSTVALPAPFPSPADPGWAAATALTAPRTSSVVWHPAYEAGQWEFLGSGVTPEHLRIALPGGRSPVQDLTAGVGRRRADMMVERFDRFLTAPYTRGCAQVYAGFLGSLVRTRAAALRWLVAAVADRWSRPARLSSFAGGSAYPLTSLTQDLLKAGTAVEQVTLVDRDPLALGIGRAVAERAGLECALDAVRHNVISEQRRGVGSLHAALGWHQQSVIEALDLVEQLPDPAASTVLRKAGEVLAPGGVLVFANLLPHGTASEHRPHDLPWTTTVPRSPDQVLEVVRAAGFLPRQCHIVIPSGAACDQIVLIDTARS